MGGYICNGGSVFGLYMQKVQANMQTEPQKETRFQVSENTFSFGEPTPPVQLKLFLSFS